MQTLHVRLLVGDDARSSAFLRDVLRLKAALGDETSGDADLSVNGETTLGVFQRSEQEVAVQPRPPGDEAVLPFGVADLDRSAADHPDLLVGSSRDRTDWSIRVAHLRDPEGNPIEVNQPLASP